MTSPPAEERPAAPKHGPIGYSLELAVFRSATCSIPLAVFRRAHAEAILRRVGTAFRYDCDVEVQLIQFLAADPVRTARCIGAFVAGIAKTVDRGPAPIESTADDRRAAYERRRGGNGG